MRVTSGSTFPFKFLVSVLTIVNTVKPLCKITSWCPGQFTLTKNPRFMSVLI